MTVFPIATSPTDYKTVLIWSFVLIVILLVGFALLTRVKRALRNEIDPNPGAAAGFTLSDLRRMHREGLISDEELDKAKAKIVDAARRASASDSSSKDLAGH